jgi:fluoride ion exporter CrcB/FEX
MILLSTVNNIIIFVLQIIGSGLCVYLCTLSTVNNNIIIFVFQIIGSGLCVYLCTLSTVDIIHYQLSVKTNIMILLLTVDKVHK